MFLVPIELQPLVDIVTTHPAFLGIARHVGEKAGNAIIEAVVKRVIGDRLDSELQITKLDRMGETVEELAAEVGRLRTSGAWDEGRAAHEAGDPSFQNFVDRAAIVATGARVESRRRLVGRLIARRLQIEDSEVDDIQLGNALTILEAVSQGQLLALAAIRLLQDLGTPDRPLPDLAAGEAWLSERHGSVVQEIMNGGGWNDTGLESLGNVGAIIQRLHRSGNYLGGEHADAVMQWQARHDISPFETLNENAGSPEWQAEMSGRFPTTSALSALARGKAFNVDKQRVNYRLDEQALTPVGELLASEVLANLYRRTTLSDV